MARIFSFLDRQHSIASPGYSRWILPPAAWAINLSIGQVYSFSVYKLPLTHSLGITHAVAGDWSQTSVAWIFSFAIAVLGCSAAVLGGWMDRVGPRRATFYAAVCFATGFFGSAIGVHFHQLWLVYLSYGFIGGIGLGLGYITPVATLMRWFPDRPGLATGIAMIGFGAGAMVGSPLALGLMRHFASATSTGVEASLIVMGVVYFIAMVTGSLFIKLPPERSGLPLKAAQSEHSVSAKHAVRTPQFWLLWVLVCTNSIAGFGIIEQASPMIQDFFPVGPAIAATFVSVLSFFNVGGRFLWASLSDYLGRKRTFLLLHLIGICLYWFLPDTGSSHGNSMHLFFLLSGIAISLYGGGFSIAPSYTRELFGTREVGAIYGRLQTATASAGILGPILVNAWRQHEIARGLSTSEAYRAVLHFMILLILLSVLANLLIRPVRQERSA
jgi:MFS family permease